MKITYLLKKLGLSDQEAQIYLALIKIPREQPASLVAKRLNMNRTTVYKILNELSKKGWVNKTKRFGSTCFFDDDPEKNLKKKIEDQKKELALMNEVVHEELPLITLADLTEERHAPKIRYYEGIEGIKQIYEIILKERKDIYYFGDISNIYEILGSYTDEFIGKRIKLGIKTHAILPHSSKKTEVDNKKELRNILYVPRERFLINGEIRIFGNKVAIISLSSESAIGIVITSEIIAKMFYSIFMLMWTENISKKRHNDID